MPFIFFKTSFIITTINDFYILSILENSAICSETKPLDVIINIFFIYSFIILKIILKTYKEL